jgi:hypothetical protein
MMVSLNLIDKKCQHSLKNIIRHHGFNISIRLKFGNSGISCNERNNVFKNLFNIWNCTTLLCDLVIGFLPGFRINPVLMYGRHAGGWFLWRLREVIKN